MKNIFSSHNHSLEVPIHIITWVMIFFFPILFIDRQGNGVDWMEYVRHCVNPLAFCIIFYINYFELIPKLLLNKKTNRYIIVNIVLILLMGISLTFFMHFLGHGPSHPGPRHLFDIRWIFFIQNLFMMAVTAGLAAAIRMSQQWAKAEAARQEAEKSRSEAELKNLRSQLNPHFLLNTLNNIYALIAFNSDRAQEAVQELSKLLRHVLYDNQQSYVVLSKETDFILNYIELMKIRLSKEVKVDVSIDIRPNSQTKIAPLIFISLIENAFKHGISPTEPSFIQIKIGENEEGEVCCDIRNSNFPKSIADKSGSGIGLEQVRKRLELMYPDKYQWIKHVSEDGNIYSSILTIQTK